MSHKKTGCFYILLEDQAGHEKGKSFLDSGTSTNELKGTIYSDAKPSKDRIPNEYTFTSIENKERSVTCSRNTMMEIDKKDANLLVSIPSKNQRLKMFRSDLYKQIKNAERGDVVYFELDEYKRNKRKARESFPQ